MENKKTKIVSIIAIIALVLTVITATYAYFQAQTGEGSQTDVKITSSTVDTLSFETGSSLTFTADQDTFANGKASLSDTTFAKAILTANNKTNSATNNYNLYLNISDNNFTYTQDTSTPELLLQITDASNNSITSIDGLTYKTVTDNKNTSISGFDITNKTGLINLFTNREITTTSKKTEEWTIKITFVNYNKDQSANAGKSFNGQILISKDTFDNYTPNTINTLSATKNGTSLTVNLNVEQGSNEIDKYYYAIEETNGIAVLNNTSKVQRLSNRLAVSNLTYVESSSSSHTFTNLSSTKDYKVSAYAVDKRKVKTNTYEYNVYSGSYVYPTISKVETSTTSNSVTATVTATKGTNNISKYYYSIDGGATYIESENNSYTLNNLSSGIYKLMVKLMDTNGKYSNVYIKNVTFIAKKMTLAEYVIAQYIGVQGANGIYLHNSSLTNGAGDNSYRYAGASDEINNFVCFGSEASSCPEDNLYRIIGVFNNQIKLVKYTIATNSSLGTDGAYSSDNSYKFTEYDTCPEETAFITPTTTMIKDNKNVIGWRVSAGCQEWKYSNLNTINLNKNFVEKFSSTWSNKIADTNWSLGELSTTSITAKDAYLAEVTNASNTYFKTDGTSKIGLLYISDYAYASPNDKWSDYLSAYQNSINWLNSITSWTLTKSSSDGVYSLSNSGEIGVYIETSVHPVFYLKTDVNYENGLGTKNNPIRIL